MNEDEPLSDTRVYLDLETQGNQIYMDSKAVVSISEFYAMVTASTDPHTTNVAYKSIVFDSLSVLPKPTSRGVKLRERAVLDP